MQQGELLAFGHNLKWGFPLKRGVSGGGDPQAPGLGGRGSGQIIRFLHGNCRIRLLFQRVRDIRGAQQSDVTLRVTWQAPRLTSAEKASAFNEVAGDKFDAQVQNFISVLSENNRLAPTGTIEFRG